MARDTMYLYGKNSITERLKADPGSIKRVFIRDNFNGPDILSLLEARRIPAKRVSERELSRIKHADRLQGIVAEVDKFRYKAFEDALGADGAGNGPSLIFIDSINDPHNLGSIIRIAACFGGFAIVIPRHSSCEVNDTVMHVASGGENFVSVSMVSNIPAALIKAKKRGYWIVGAALDGEEDLNSFSVPFPVCLVLGSEGRGIRRGIRKQLDMRVRLPMRGAALSFNVSVACAIFCHEINRQRMNGGGEE